MTHLDPIVPKALPANANIALISPSSRINNLVPDALARSINLLTSLGYRVTTFFFNDGEDADVVVANGKSIAASIANRLGELRAAFSDPSFDAVLCTVGGPTMTELIPSLVEDAELHRLVRENPKILIGYSDITVLHWSLRALTGLRTFYGPCSVSELGEAATSTPESLASFASRNAAPETAASRRTDDEYLQDFHLVSLLAALSRPQPLGTVPRSKFYAPIVPPYFLSAISAMAPRNPRLLLPSPAWKWLRPGRAEGRLFGGCLTVVARIQGIPRITPDWKGRILFLESAMAEGELSKGNPLGKVRQAVADIAAHGVFDEIAGLVIGRPYGYDTERARAEYAAVFRGLLCCGRLAEHQFPILMNVDIGHTAPMVTLPMDSLALLDSDRDEFAITEAAVI
ncbi:peptidase U61 LD-carboxypeptidase A protein [Colletotrichum plurivorum]|uniref:Peptidase U61 LD-carboxypeptidase A protein n=1 Tax=Colletotrichum plurivorum TaxID=2175906 RepID=A0A8H6KMC8_9PEZI|nr:peptidase U61 LD-carboxypeptidase A protein [Colletotrichum plurivorum]